MSIREILEKYIGYWYPVEREYLRDEDIKKCLHDIAERVGKELNKIKRKHPSSSKNYSFNDGWLCGVEVAIAHIKKVIEKE